MTIRCIVSGGQTGVDQAALDTAIKLNISYGGWCPAGRLAENGRIPEHYALKETARISDYSERTRRNIRDSDAALIFMSEMLPTKAQDGTVLTIHEAQSLNKPYFIVDLSKNIPVDDITDWIQKNKIEILNIAGPRESSSRGIYSMASHAIEHLYLHWLTLGVLVQTGARPSCQNACKILKRMHRMHFFMR